MSLSYRLDTTNYPWWGRMEEWLGNAENGQGYRNGSLIDGANERWNGGGFLGGQTSAPTGEYIIRDGYYHNGIYIMVGSYRGYFSQLEATGAPGFAWDGFILYHRGYNLLYDVGAADVSRMNPADYSVFPMMWPTICGDAALSGLLNDDTVGTGLYAVTPIKSEQDLVIGGTEGQDTLNIVVGGYHVAPTTNITDAETIGAAAIITNVWLGGNEEGRIYYKWQNDESMWLGYDYDLSMLTPTQTMKYRDWKDVIAMGNTALFGATPYERVLWEQGVKPDGTNLIPGPTSTDNGIENNGYLPLKILGVRSVSGVTYGAGAGADIDGVVYMCGQMATSDASKEIETKCPFYMSLDFDPKTLRGMWLGVPPLNYLGPWCVATVAYSSTIIPGIASPYDSGLGIYIHGFQCADTTGGTSPSKNIQALYDAAALDILPPAELVGSFSGGNVSPMLLTLGGTQYPEYPTTNPRGALYTANGFPIDGDQCLPIGVAGGAIEDNADIYLPSIGFAASLQQFRTYTFSEENVSMEVLVGRGDKREATPNSVWDRDTDQFVGWKGNYPRYDTAETGGIVAGKQTFVGYAAVGWYDPSDGNIPADRHGPCLLSYDSGDPATTFVNTSGGPPPAPVTQGKVEFNIRTREDGGKLNAAIGVGGGGAPSLRRCDWAGWDNDRDQWLFVVAGDGEGVSIVSVDAPFTTFLDQSDAFGTAGQNPKWETAMYYPLSMSNSLDGMVVFGERIQDDLGNVGMQAIYGPEYDATLPWGVGTYKAKTSAEMAGYRIDGSTGRTARVWIDYMLYDGVDAVIAMQLRDWGMRVTVENVEWFKARVLQDGDIKAKGEEIEQWMDEQGRQYQDMMKEKERGGRLRKRRSQISAYKREVGDLMTPDQMDTQVYDFVPKGIAAQQRLKTSEGALKEVPPDSIEAMVERDYRAGFDTTPSGVVEPGDQLPEDPAKPAGTFMDTGDAPKKAPDEGGDPDEEYISED